ncbi:MAG: thioesterase domain-containing protein, partial [Bacteroidota bacterium]
SAAFKAKLKSYGGFDAEILENEEAYEFFEPIIRADMQALETWQYQAQTPLDIPATVLSGTNEDITEAELRAWSLEFSGEIQFEVFEGDHFFLFEHAEAFSNILKQRLFEGALN